MTPHLTEAQLDDMLHSASRPAADLHLASCSRCQEELTTLQQAFGGFRLAATNASRLHTPARPAMGQPAPRGFFSFPPPVQTLWSAGLAVMLALTALIVPAFHKRAERAMPTPRAVAARDPAPLSDEALLNDIDSDLSTSVPPSLQPLDTTTQTTVEPTISPASN